MRQIAPAGAAKLNRVERNAWTKQKIFEAATKVVGKYGSAEASVARITDVAADPSRVYLFDAASGARVR